MGGGGVLNKMVPGYKDLVWNKLPAEIRKAFILNQQRRVERNYYDQCIRSTGSLEQYTRWLQRFVPSYESRIPAVDYKRQEARGTLVEGRDFYAPTTADATRLLQIVQPYTDAEQERRAEHARYDLKLALALICGGIVYWDWKQSRPVAWCFVYLPVPAKHPWFHKVNWRGHDVKSVRRGFEVFRAVCSSCHSIKKCKWWYLMKDVYPVRRVQELAAEKTMVDALNDEGELNIRPCMTWDYFPKPFPTEEAAKHANNGKEPPDFSEGPYNYQGGADYMFCILTGYRDPPVGVKLSEGTWYNPWFAGGVIGMPPPLEDGLVDYEDGTPATVSQMAKDVVSFLTFVADPCSSERRLMIIKYIAGAMIAFPAFFYGRRFGITGAFHRRIDFERIRLM